MIIFKQINIERIAMEMINIMAGKRYFRPEFNPKAAKGYPEEVIDGATIAYVPTETAYIFTSHKVDKAQLADDLIQQMRQLINTHDIRTFKKYTPSGSCTLRWSEYGSKFLDYQSKKIPKHNSPDCFYNQQIDVVSIKNRNFRWQILSYARIEDLGYELGKAEISGVMLQKLSIFLDTEDILSVPEGWLSTLEKKCFKRYTQVKEFQINLAYGIHPLMLELRKPSKKKILTIKKGNFYKPVQNVTARFCHNCMNDIFDECYVGRDTHNVYCIICVQYSRDLNEDYLLAKTNQSISDVINMLDLPEEKREIYQIISRAYAEFKDTFCSGVIKTSDYILCMDNGLLVASMETAGDLPIYYVQPRPKE